MQTLVLARGRERNCELSVEFLHHIRGRRGPALGGRGYVDFAVPRPDDVTDGLTRAQTIIYSCYDV